jgi:putative ABC transport system substrate-binding protein
MKKTIFTLLTVIAAIPTIFLMCNSNKPKDTNINRLKIGVCKVIEHEALNSVVLGMKDYLEKTNSNSKKSFDISVETSQGNMAIASQIIAKFAGSNCDVVVTIGTTPSQCAYKLAKDRQIKLVFSSVTNPSDISEDLRGNNTCGVSNFVALEPQLQLFKKIQPKLKNLGIIYNTGEANSVSIIKKLRESCRKEGINLQEQGISRISDLVQVVNKLAKTVDAVFISNDNLALSGIPTIVAICNQNKIPVYVSDTDQVEKGCLAALGPNQYAIGQQTGEIVQKIVAGEDINKMEVAYPTSQELYINMKAADILGISLPEEVVRQAKVVIKK